MKKSSTKAVLSKTNKKSKPSSKVSKKAKGEVKKTKVTKEPKDSKAKEVEEVVTFQFRKPNFTFILLLILGILALGQTALIVKLSSEVKSVEAEQLTNGSGGGSSTQLKELQDLPEMVGGC